MKRYKGFTLIELLVVLMIIFFVLISLGSVFIIPWALEKYVGDTIIVNNNVSVVALIDDTVTVITGQKFRVEVEPSFLSTEKIVATIAKPLPGAAISKQLIGNKFWFVWSSEDLGIFEVEIIFSDGENSSKSKITIDVIKN